MKKLSLLFILSIILFSCSKDKVDPNVGPITIEFDNRHTDDLTLTIDYDVTNITLKRSDNTVFSDGKVIHHVSAADEGSQEITLQNVPSGNYTQVSFTIQSLKVSGSFAYESATTSVTLAMPGDGAPVRAEHEPEAHLIFDMNKLKTGSDVASAIVVDHVHAN